LSFLSPTSCDLNLLLPFRRIAHREDHKIDAASQLLKVSAICSASGMRHFVYCSRLQPELDGPVERKTLLVAERARNNHEKFSPRFFRTASAQSVPAIHVDLLDLRLPEFIPGQGDPIDN
jgi:hypothetical protein